MSRALAAEVGAEKLEREGTRRGVVGREGRRAEGVVDMAVAVAVVDVGVGVVAGGSCGREGDG